MTRTKRGNVARKRRHKVLRFTRGFRGSSSRLFRQGNQQRMKALKFTYRHRRESKRTQRRLWINRINAAVRERHINYSEFIYALKSNQVLLNRKWLSQLSVRDPDAFAQLMLFIGRRRNMNPKTRKKPK